MRERGLDPSRFGWASVQLDGGIESVVEKVETWFDETLSEADALAHVSAGPEALRLGLYAAGPFSDDAARSLADIVLGPSPAPEARSSSGEGGGALLAGLPRHGSWGSCRTQHPVLRTAGNRTRSHAAEAPTDHWIETATGLGATGVEVMVAHVAGRPLQAHRMIPLLQISSDPETLESYADDLDVLLEGDATFWADQTLRELASSPLARGIWKLKEVQATRTSSSHAVCSASRCRRKLKAKRRKGVAC